MAGAERERGRILLALDSASPLGPTLEAAAALAASLRAELAALFVEDERLLRLAELPFAREIGFASATLQSFGLAEMEQALRVQAAQVRRALDALASRQALAWTLDVIRGEMLAASLGRLEPGDVLVLSRSHHGPLPLGGPVPRPARAAAPGPVVVLSEDPDDAKRGLEIGYTLARETRSAMVVLIAAANERSFRSRSRFAERWLEERGGSARCVQLRDAQASTVIGTVRELRPAALVWPARGVSGDPAALSRALDELACPIVLVR